MARPQIDDGKIRAKRTLENAVGMVEGAIREARKAGASPSVLEGMYRAGAVFDDALLADGQRDALLDGEVG